VTASAAFASDVLAVVFAPKLIEMADNHCRTQMMPQMATL
jgi:hypothetical protein